MKYFENGRQMKYTVKDSSCFKKNFYWFLERETSIFVSLTFMHSSLDSYTCPDQGLNLQPQKATLNSRRNF